MGVREPVMVVEHHDGGDHARGHHEHDAVEVGACQSFKKVSQGTPFGGEKTARSVSISATLTFYLKQPFVNLYSYILERQPHFCKVFNVDST